MTAINYRLADGSVRTVDVPAGRSVMQGAVANDVPGIVGECGGNVMCATCHVYVDSESNTSQLPEISELEEEMLECTVAPRTEDSRLSCQLKVTSEWGPLAVLVPERQL